MQLKYSFLMPYYRRSDQLRSTFDTFIHHYRDRSDFEIVISEDLKNNDFPTEHKKLLDIVEKYSKVFPITLVSKVASHNPSIHQNLCAQLANGRYLIITNPECAHQTDVLKGFDEEFARKTDIYIVCACKSIDKMSATINELPILFTKWFQHSVYRNARIHFCTALTRNNYMLLGGFDETYCKGMCFEDDDFRNKIDSAGIEFVLRDDLIVVHLDHIKNRPANYLAAHHTNKLYYEQKWGSKYRTAERTGAS